MSKRKEADFLGRGALRQGRPPRWRTQFVRLDDPQSLLHHDEPILREGRQIGRVTSGAYCWTVGGACGIALIDEHEALEMGNDPSKVKVTCGATSVEATLAPHPFYDPTGSRLR